MSGWLGAGFGAPAPQKSGDPAEGWSLVVLGIAQDGGIPHLRCLDPPCSDVRAGRRRAEKVSSIGLVNRALGLSYVFDATPDFPAQLHSLTGGAMPTGIFLTHAHIGHYTGLMYLGKEAVSADRVPVYGTTRMVDYLTKNGPWSLLVSDHHIAPVALTMDRPVELTGGIRVTAFPVPHREEFTDTVGFLIEGPRAKALYIPDIDRWEKWSRSIRELANQVDLAFLDGTFSSPAEIKSRSITEIPHPMIPATRTLLQGVRAHVWFIHLNHTNPALSGASDVAQEGMTFGL